jgi:asparagine synthase (glutamine-hydrolysing)
VPGIVGFISKMPRAKAEQQLARMVETIRHEPFYRMGTWIDDSQGLYIGWTAIENSFADRMPLRDQGNCLTLVFSGEEYSNGPAQSKDQKSSSYLLERCANDAAFPASLNGLFHGVLVDRKRGSAMLFNDRYGMHRLYYHQAKDGFFFAAEAKAILAVRPELRVPCPQGIGEFIACGCVLENRTIFKDIYVLPAASAWTLRDGQVEQKHTYFDPREWEQQTTLDPQSYYEQLRDALFQSLPHYFDSGERIGIALTGGMDTRVILALHRPPSGSLPAYTFGGMLRECQDVRIARKVAQICGQSHSVITVGDDFLRQFPEYAERTMHLAEGCLDVYRASDLYVSQKAREIAPIKVVGTYGSEIVRHAVMFKPMAPADGTFKPDFLAHVHRASATYSAVKNVHPVTFAAFRQSPWYHHGVLGLEQTQLTVRSPYLDNNFVKTVYRSPKLSSGDVRLQLIQGGSKELGSIPSDRGVGGIRGPLASKINHAYLEFTFKAEYAYDYGMPQWLARLDCAASALHLERLFLGRHKFLHYRVWYRDALAGYVKEILLDNLTLSRPYLERKSIETMVNGHLRGDRNYTSVIHKMLSLELLQRHFFDPQ